MADGGFNPGKSLCVGDWLRQLAIDGTVLRVFPPGRIGNIAAVEIVALGHRIGKRFGMGVGGVDVAVRHVEAVFKNILAIQRHMASVCQLDRGIAVAFLPVLVFKSDVVGPGIVVHAHAAGDIGMKLLDLEIVGLPALLVDGFQRQIAVFWVHVAFRLLEHVGGLGGIDDAFSGDFCFGAVGENNAATTTLYNVLNFLKVANCRQEPMPRRRNQFFGTPTFKPSKTKPALRNVFKYFCYFLGY
jgi:hypothetical protein